MLGKTFITLLTASAAAAAALRGELTPQNTTHSLELTNDDVNHHVQLGLSFTEMSPSDQKSFLAERLNLTSAQAETLLNVDPEHLQSQLNENADSGGGMLARVVAGLATLQTAFYALAGLGTSRSAEGNEEARVWLEQIQALQTTPPEVLHGAMAEAEQLSSTPFPLSEKEYIPSSDAPHPSASGIAASHGYIPSSNAPHPSATPSPIVPSHQYVPSRDATPGSGGAHQGSAAGKIAGAIIGVVGGGVGLVGGRKIYKSYKAGPGVLTAKKKVLDALHKKYLIDYQQAKPEDRGAIRQAWKEKKGLCNDIANDRKINADTKKRNLKAQMPRSTSPGTPPATPPATPRQPSASRVEGANPAESDDSDDNSQL